jgi:energy-coupling factor transport system substrate-specific component
MADRGKRATLIAALAALAGGARVPFAFIPSVQPTTFLVMLYGYVFGWRAGAAAGALAAVVSNFFLGQGPWTLGQMAGWGLAGAVGGWLAGQNVRQSGWTKWRFLIVCTFYGYLFGWLMNLWYWYFLVYPHTWLTFWASGLRSFPLDTLHATGNLLFTLTLGRTTYWILMRFKRRM